MFNISYNVPINSSNVTMETTPGDDCFRLKIIGFYLIFIFLVGIFCNLGLLDVFYRKKELRTPLHILVIAVTINNLFGCLFELPLVIISNFYCK